MSTPRPIWRLTMGGDDLTQILDPRLMQLTLTDNRGLEADQLDITLSDADGLLDIPARGATLQLALGWSDSGLIDKGTYTVDEIEHSGTPDQLTIRARSADLAEGLTDKKERSWHNTNIGAIVKKIARENALTAAVSPDLAGQAVGHEDQQSESDASFLTRLGEMFDAIATVKEGNLLFFRIGRGCSASGEPFPEVSITRAVGDKHRFAIADRESYETVEASYYDAKGGAKKTVTVYLKKEGEKKKKNKVNADGKGKKTLRHVYASRGNAQRAAKSALDKAKRGASTFSISLALGRPDIIPELPVSVIGWKPSIDGTEWRITKCTHALSGSGLTTQLELEIGEEPGEEGSDERDD